VSTEIFLIEFQFETDNNTSPELADTRVWRKTKKLRVIFMDYAIF
jgi:hypothetical protein